MTQTPNPALVRYITTAIPFVNAAPHLGFALEVIHADTLARFYRQRGDDVRLLAGTDENSIKNVRAAEAAGETVFDLVERNAARFQALPESLNLSYDDFIRTSVDPRHPPGVIRLWQACCERGDIYKRSYKGLYCVGCEQFYKSDELAGGRCPEHDAPLEEIEEENWFFRLSNYAEQLRDLYRQGTIKVVPHARQNEISALIERGLEDFSISRSAGRARGWGIPVPGDPGQVIYVWFDALANYITALGYGTDEALLARYWADANARDHVIGKGITRFHAVYWPAILLSAGLPLPTRILVHGYLTTEGRKISKSLGNAIEPAVYAERFGADALRYFLLRHIRTTEDGDFSLERFEKAYKSELAGQLGNLVHRTLSIIERSNAGALREPSKELVEHDTLIQHALSVEETVTAHLNAYAFDRALDAIWKLVAEANKYVADQQPWAHAKAVAAAQTADERQTAATRLNDSLYSVASTLQIIATVLTPFMPSIGAQLLQKLGLEEGNDGHRPSLTGAKIAAGEPLFPMDPVDP
ncbi:methionine--tRNA ligase [Rhizobium sp. PL01]|uniref:methionine--tRNA ligase n=1 Tax=Rhizobium sp. PL01 TaxID=3085631 RepID=UPI0029826C77|nr:methionine--tRNA ligase [Rhizobium sp. PL01]MDW5312949.1 methionine--tRNA ligase [Rhizobium sp. PL01]